MPGENGFIHGFSKNKRERVVGELSEYRGRLYAHIRIVVPASGNEGWVRTVKGVGIEASRFGELHQLIQRLPTALELEGVVGTLRLSRDEIRVGVDRYQGNGHIYMRRYFEKDGEWLPTRRGISLRTEHCPALLELADLLAEAIESKGQTGA